VNDLTQETVFANFNTTGTLLTSISLPNTYTVTPTFLQYNGKVAFVCAGACGIAYASVFDMNMNVYVAVIDVNHGRINVIPNPNANFTVFTSFACAQ